MTRYGPGAVRRRHRPGPRSTEPRLITSFTEFERVYGGLEQLNVDRRAADRSESYLAHAARAFFLNGGQRLYVSRVFAPRDPAGGAPTDCRPRVRAASPFGPGGRGDLARPLAGRLRQRALTVRPIRKRNVALQHPTFGPQAHAG